jgi:hypothetical protein
MCFAAGLTSCSSLKITHDYDRGRDYSGYETFKVLPSKSISRDEINEALKLMITRELANKGLDEVDGRPDLLVTYDGRLDSHEQIAKGLGYAVETINGETTVFTVSRGVPIGVLYVSIIERSSGTIVWKAHGQAEVKRNVEPKERVERLEAIIAKVFAPYPAR